MPCSVPIDESLQLAAAAYAAGTMSAPEREQFDLILEFHHGLRAHVAELESVVAAVTLAALPAAGPRPSAGLKARVIAAVEARAQASSSGFVVSDPSGLVLWVNPAFSEMCGYSVEELRGKKLGPILQGEKTDAGTVQRMREAVHAHRPCHETILNYHKDGTPYWVEIAITPILDDAGQARWLVAREREVSEEKIAA